jgi:hypothetical protein
MWNISASARRNLLLISALGLCSLPMYGQTANTGAIAVSVSDPSGALVRQCSSTVRPHEKSAISLPMPREISRSHSCRLATMT